jgi:hypothetical protein
MRRERKEAIWRIVYYLVGFAIGVLAGLRMESCHTHPTPAVSTCMTRACGGFDGDAVWAALCPCPL